MAMAGTGGIDARGRADNPSSSLSPLSTPALNRAEGGGGTATLSAEALAKAKTVEGRRGKTLPALASHSAAPSPQKHRSPMPLPTPPRSGAPPGPQRCPPGAAHAAVDARFPLFEIALHPLADHAPWAGCGSRSSRPAGRSRNSAPGARQGCRPVRRRRARGAPGSGTASRGDFRTV